MDEVTLAKESYQLVRKDFGLEETTEIAGADIAFDWLEEYLTKQVNYMLDHDFNYLLNALYRIDIPEERIQELLQIKDHSFVGRSIAQAIIEREKQKIITREQYR